jgi:hypothetical protein
MVRNISVPKAKIMCYPGARVQDIRSLLPTVLPQMPGADTVVVHVGSNDIRRASSELIFVLKDSKQRPIISGPEPSLGRGCDRFSRLLALHIWLKDYSSSAGVTFIDNFDTFWKQKIPYRNDGDIQIILAPGLCPHFSRLH